MVRQIHNSKILPPLLFLIIITTGFFLRVWTTRWEPLLSYPDTTQYLNLAREIQSSTYFQSDYKLDEGFLKSRQLPPFYPMLVAVFAHLPFEIECIGIWISIIMSILTFIPLYLTGSHLYSKTSGLIATALFSFHPFALQWASPALTESTFTFLFVSSLAGGLWAIHIQRPLPFILTGVCAALCYLTREIGIVVICLATFWGFIMLLTKNKSFYRPLLLIALMLCTFTITIMPHLLAIKFRTGHWGLSYQASNKEISTSIFRQGGNQYDRFKLPGEETNVNTFRGNSPLEMFSFITSKLTLNSVLYLKEFLNGVGWSSLGWFFLAMLFVVIQFLVSSWQNSWKELYLISWIVSIILLYALITPYMVDRRYMFPLLVPALILCAQGISQSWDWIKKFFHSKIVTKKLFNTIACPILLPFMMVVIIFSQEWPSIQKLHQINFKPCLAWSSGQKEVAQYLLDQQLALSGAKVISYKPYMAFYLEGKAITLPKTFEELQQKIKEHEGDLLVADSSELALARPLLLDLAFGGLVLAQPGPVIYSRLFPEFKKIITVYDLRQQKTPFANLTDYPESTKDRLKKAETFYREGFLYHAEKEYLNVLNQDRDNHEAIKMLAQIYLDYYIKTETPNILPVTIKVLKKYLDIVPDDKQMKGLYTDLCKEASLWKIN